MPSRPALLLILLLPGVALAQDGDPKPPKADWTKAYATVGEAEILRADVDADVKKGLPKAQALQRRITLAILSANLLREGMDPKKVTAKELDEVVEEARAKWRKRGVELEKVLRQSGQSLADFKEGMRIPICFRNYVRGLLTDERLKKLYKEHALTLSGEVRASQLLVRIDEKRTAVQARERAEKLRSRLGKAPTAAAFEQLSQRESDDPMAALTGGDLDWFTARGNRQVPVALVGAAFRHGKQGLLSRVIRGRRGFYLLYVTGIRLPKSASFERLRPKLMQRAETLEASKTMEGWLARTRIRYAPDAPRPGKKKKKG